MRAFTSRVAMVLLGAVATVVAVGAGASAFGPARSEVVAYELDAQRTVDTSGANASPGPTPAAPSRARRPRPRRRRRRRPRAAASRARSSSSSSSTWPRSRRTARSPSTACSPPPTARRSRSSRSGTGSGRSTASPAATTADVARRIAGSLAPAEQAKCHAGSGTTSCVDLTLQTIWVIKNGGRSSSARPSSAPACRATRRRPARSRSTTATSGSGPTRTRSGCPYWQHFTARRRLPRDHHVHAQHRDRLARLRQPAAQRRQGAVDHDRLRHHRQALRPAPRHLSPRPRGNHGCGGASPTDDLGDGVPRRAGPGRRRPGRRRRLTGVLVVLAGSSCRWLVLTAARRLDRRVRRAAWPSRCSISIVGRRPRRSCTRSRRPPARPR